MTRYIVTITPPTPNGDLHLGHLSGPFLSADVFARSRRLFGDEVLLVSYSDDYQSYMARKSREQGAPVPELAHRNAAKIRETMELADIAVDHFLESYGNRHFIAAVRMFYEQAKRAGAVYDIEDMVPYCQRCDTFGYEALARGRCNFCGALSDASQCETCARWPSVQEMEALACTLCKGRLGWRSVRREALRLGESREYLAFLYRNRPLRPILRDFIDTTLQQTQLDWPITRPHEVGTNIGTDTEPKLVHTWFSGMAGYYAAVQELGELRGHPEWIEHYWHDPRSRVVHFLGFDCSFSHALVYPALMRHFEAFPKDVYLYPNAFLKLNGEDFSTSRGHAIWVRDILREVSPDALRFYLASFAPENAIVNFVEADFHRWHREVYRNKSNRMMQVAMDEVTAGAAPTYSEYDLQFCVLARQRWRRAVSLEHFSISALAAVMSDTLEYITNKIDTSEGPVTGLLEVYATMGMPIHPRVSNRILKVTGANTELLRKWLCDVGTSPLELSCSAARNATHAAAPQPG